MAKAVAIILLLAATGCAGLPGVQHAVSPCVASEASPACQVERYHNVSQ